MDSRAYLLEASLIARQIDDAKMEQMAIELSSIRAGGHRLYIIGLGGSLANAIHMAADLRKLCEMDAVAPENMAELTARANDEGMDTVFTGWLRFLNPGDGLLVLSVGGGTDAVSAGIAKAARMAKAVGARVLGIVGPHGGVTKEVAHCCVQVPAPAERQTPHTEAFQAVIWHCLVSHPLLQRNATKW